MNLDLANMKPKIKMRPKKIHEEARERGHALNKYK
jgi:hypothetical protein